MPLVMKVVKVVVVVMVVVEVVMVAVANDDKVLAVPADIVDAGHGVRNVASLRARATCPSAAAALFRACGTAADVVSALRAGEAY